MLSNKCLSKRALGMMACAAFGVCWLQSARALADGLIYIPGAVVIDHPHPVPRPRRIRPPRPHFPMQVTRHKVSVTIDETVARTRVEETFYNPNARQLEGVYLFPLPVGAAVSNFKMTMGGKLIAGEVLDKDKARQIYTDIVRRSRDPGLLEYVDRGLFRASVFPIPARGGIDVVIEYSETLKRDAGMSTYRYPLDTGKYSSGPYQNVVIDVVLRSGSPLRSISCPSHDGTQVTRKGENEARVTFEAKSLAADQDFLLNWNVSADTLAPALLAYRGSDRRGFFYLSVRPRLETTKNPLPKDIVFVIDTSGSMLGEKLDHVKKALRYVLKGLNKDDRFNIVSFATEERAFRDQLVALSEREAAETFITELTARGGTNLEAGLRVGLTNLKDKDRLQMLVVLTDGEPTIGMVRAEEILKSVKDNNTHRRRLFVFGVGADLNTKILDRLALDTAGRTTYLRGDDNLEIALSAFYDKIDSPVLTDLKLEFPQGGANELYPRPLPDLFGGEQLEILGRYDVDGDKSVVLRGKYLGKEEVFEYRLAFNPGNHDYLARLWAMRKVGYLLEQMRLVGESKEVKDEIVRIAKRYGVVTPYTSYLIIEEGEVARRAGRALPNAATAAAESALADEYNARVLSASRLALRRDRGAEAVDASRQIEELKEKKSVDKLRWYAGKGAAGGVPKPAAPGEVAAIVAPSRVKTLGALTFYFATNRWIDSRVTPKLMADKSKKRAMKYLSDEYFKLITDEPKIGKLLSVAPYVTVVWKGAVIEVTP